MNVSIVLCSHNGSRFIGQQLASIAEQQLLPEILIVSDDNSSDSTVAIVEEFAKTAPFPVKLVVNSPALGYAENFLTACSLATTDFISLCDQDDIWTPDNLREIAADFRNFPTASMVIHSALVVDEDLKSLDATHPRIVRSEFYPAGTYPLRARPPGFAMTFRRELLMKYGWKDRPQDLEFETGMSKHDSWLVALANAEGGIFCDKRRFALYRRHEKNFSFFRGGSDVTRRIRQMSDSLRAPNIRSIERLATSLEDHADYFIAAGKRLGGADTERLRRIGARYAEEAALQRTRLDYYRLSRIERAVSFIRQLGSGKYGGLLQKRRDFIQDLVGILR